MKIKKILVVLVCFTAFSLRSLAASDMFLEMDGIQGEAQDKGHAGAIQVLGWAFEMSNTLSTSSGGGAGVGKVAVHDISITKWVDKATTDLMKACATGQHIKKAVLFVRKSGERPVEYLKVTLEDILISGLSINGNRSDDRPTESISLNFSKFKVEYTQQGGRSGGAVSTFELDLNGPGSNGGQPN